jgi:hypothetical protein
MKHVMIYLYIDQIVFNLLLFIAGFVSEDCMKFILM